MTQPEPVAITVNPWIVAGLTEIVLGVIAISSVLTTTLGGEEQSASHTAALIVACLLVVTGLISLAVTLVNIGTRRAIADGCTCGNRSPGGTLPKADTADLRKAAAAAYVQQAMIKYRRTSRTVRR